MIIKFFQSTHTSSTSNSFTLCPREATKSIVSDKGKLSSCLPRVIFNFCYARTFAARIGAVQVIPITLPASWKSFKTSATSGSTCISLPFNAKSLKLKATPNPPGISKASKSLTLSNFKSSQFPREIRADSSRMFLTDYYSKPVK